MKYVTRFVTAMILTAVCVALVYPAFPLLLFPHRCPYRGKAFDRWESDGDGFKIRVTAYEEEGRSPSAPRPYYIFESNGLGPDDWREIMTVQDESRPDIPKDHVRFVNDRVAYVFMGSRYAVTTDAGRTWSLWDAAKTLPRSVLGNYRGLEQVSLAADGKGTMQLEAATQVGGQGPDLKTTDYGYHWYVEQASR